MAAWAEVFFRPERTDEPKRNVTLHNFLLFISACIALALIPGPDMAYMLAR